MTILICPGFHDSTLTQSFVEGMQLSTRKRDRHGHLLIFPTQEYPAYSALHVLQFLRDRLDSPRESPVILIGFSAGVVGAIGAAWGWQLLGGQVAVIAIDGWGVPLYGFPCHRLSHDYFTHWSSALLGGGEDSFYADPAVAHLDLWRSPQTVEGWWVRPIGKSQSRTHLTAAQFLSMLVERFHWTRA